jgi:FG-GAP-like repeat
MLAKNTIVAVTFLVLLSLGHSASATVGFKPAQSYAVGTAPEMAAVADFNTDGKPDIAVVCFGDPSVGDDGGVSILLGNGDGTFQPATKLTTGKNPTRIATGDFNSDGKSDLIVVRLGDASVNDNGDATIFLGSGDGTFNRGQVLAPGKNPFAVAVSDLNADHKPDLVFASSTANSTDNSVTILLGNGDGTFQSPITSAVTAGGTPSSISVTDVNQDGRTDLAIFWGLSVYFFFGNGDGTFQNGPSVFAGTLRFFSTIGDFNQDGKIDLVDQGCGFLHPNNCSTSIRLGNGDGTFQPPNAIPGVFGAVAADVNGDSKLDLIGTSSDRAQLVVLLGNRDGTFQQALTFAAGTNPFIALVGDFDGDKAPDLVAINSDAAISVLLNTGTDFSISAPPLSPSSVSPGQTATSTVSLSLLNAFDNPVSLSCAVTPVQAGSPTCSLGSNSVTFDHTGKASATLTVTAGAAAASLRVPPATRGGSNLFSFGWLAVAGFVFMGISLSCTRSRTRKGTFFAVFPVVAGLILLAGCGGGSSRPPPVNYAITITAMSGSTQHSTALTLTVQ